MTTVTPLGTGSALPMRQRHFPAFAVQCYGDVLLFDCGEGTQRRMIEAGLKLTRVQGVFISHAHADHYLGLPGLLSTLQMLGRIDPLTIAAPAILAVVLDALPGASPARLGFDVDFLDLENVQQGRIFQIAAGHVTTEPVDHGAPCFGFRFTESDRPGNLDADKARSLGATDFKFFRDLKNGKDVVLDDGTVVESAEVVGPPTKGGAFAYVTDTRPCTGAIELARDVDLLAYEATFTREHAQRAVETGHSTAFEAAGVARDAGADRLLLTHFSTRYDTIDELVDEARLVFPNCDAAVELENYTIGVGTRSEEERPN